MAAKCKQKLQTLSIYQGLHGVLGKQDAHALITTLYSNHELLPTESSGRSILLVRALNAPVKAEKCQVSSCSQNFCPLCACSACHEIRACGHGFG